MNAEPPTARFRMEHHRAMTFTVPCDCGKTIEVTAPQAGTDLACSCGRVVSVPLLSQLRQSAGKGAYEAGTIDTIHRMVADGELPLGNTCAVSGLPTSDSYDLYVQCESQWIRGPGSGRYVLVALTVLFLPFWMIWVLLGKALLDEERRVLGRDRGVYTPLRVRQDLHEQLRRTRSQSQLRKLLRTVPIYAKLLDEFPRATITT